MTACVKCLEYERELSETRRERDYHAGLVASVRVIVRDDARPQRPEKRRTSPSEWGSAVIREMDRRGIETYEELGRNVDYDGNTVGNLVRSEKPAQGRAFRAIGKFLGIESPAVMVPIAPGLSLALPFAGDDEDRRALGVGA